MERYGVMRKKSIITAVIFMSLILAMTGCNKNNSKTESSSNTQSSQPSSQQSSKPDMSSDFSSNEEIPSSDVSSEANIPTVAVPIDLNVKIDGLEKYENEKKGWGQGKQVDADNRPVSCDQYQAKYGEYGGLFIMPKEEKVMYLTFDEGYENGYTEKILDALKEKDCKAVFFVTMPYVKQNPDLIKRMVDEGHAIGNHSVKHKSMPTLTDEEAISEIAELHNYMVENYNYTMTLFRPPMGEWSTRTLVVAKELGYRTILWSYAYLDYDVDKQMGVEAAFPKVSKAAHNGAIYLLHAVSKDNAEMMGDLIDNFRENGYSLELLK